LAVFSSPDLNAGQTHPYSLVMELELLTTAIFSIQEINCLPILLLDFGK